jgi:unspecific monooxygenase
LLLNAGHEATVNGLASGMLALLRHPDEMSALREADPASADKLAVEELLRYDTPLPLFNRWVLEDFDYQDSHLRRGAQVGLLYASGNRDPGRFERADELVLDRKDNPHLTFGLGIHYCLGAPLARLELQVAIRVLLERCPNLHLVSSDVKYRPGFVIRGLKSLPVKF